jgi:hypothetical protein
MSARDVAAAGGLHYGTITPIVTQAVHVQPTAPAEAAVSAGPFGDWKTIAEHGEWFDVAPPPREWLLGRAGKGALARGIVGLLVAPGGRGKTWALCQLALCIAIGRAWLGTFDVATSGRVVLALAEEPQDEVRRRLYYAAEAMGFSAEERRLAAERIVPLGLAGQLVGLVETGSGGAVLPSAVHAALLQRLGTAEHVAVILDPLARFAPDCEGGNAAATAAVQALEMLTRAPGRPAVIVAHHTPKWSRRDGNAAEQTAARGVTGLVDAVRWVGGLGGVTEGDLVFAVSKSNYSAHGDPVQLVRDEGGALRPPTSWELDKRTIANERNAAAKDSEIQRAILGCVGAQPGIGKGGLRSAVRAAGIKARNDEIDRNAEELVASAAVVDVPRGNAHKHYLPACPELARACPGQAPADACPLAPPLIGAREAGKADGAGQPEEQPLLVGASPSGADSCSACGGELFAHPTKPVRLCRRCDARYPELAAVVP